MEWEKIFENDVTNGVWSYNQTYNSNKNKNLTTQSKNEQKT